MNTFRIDDIGASTKHYNQHGKKLFSYKGIPYFYFPFANVGFFKRIPPFRQWGVYDELTAEEFTRFLNIFKTHHITPIIAITACWVTKTSKLIPFNEKFPELAKVLKLASDNSQIVIANHGLTHCMVGKHLPTFWHSNRANQREFLPSLDQSVHTEHIIRSQQILESFFNKPVEILVPPGNVWSIKTARALKQTNIRTVLCNHYMLDSNEPLQDIQYVDDRIGYVNFHDRELKLYGEKWLIAKIKASEEQ